jgi:2-polyprenyl-6-hydroxyphenyl methylase/3-demethylubiquinone-9 3-methyltransferase
MSRTILDHEIHLFNSIASQWWDEKGPFKPLHLMNPTRMSFIKDSILKHFPSLKGLKIIDVGCGGGLICEPLARLGANVTGIDASDEAIKVAMDHSTKMGLTIDYQCSSPESFEESQFDVVLALEIVEHVSDIDYFLETLIKFKPKLIILSTINRTWMSYIKAIVGAEYILRWLPKGTHNWGQFVKPSELSQGLRYVGAEVDQIVGMDFNPLSGRFSLSNHVDTNYMISAILNHSNN